MTILGRPIVALVISTKNPYKIYQVSSPLATKNALQLNSAHTALNLFKRSKGDSHVSFSEYENPYYPVIENFSIE